MNRYQDIINKKYKKSLKYKPMLQENRAAQFMPFAAVVGYDGAVKERARITEAKIELSEERKEKLNQRLAIINDCLGQNILVKITYFVKDVSKDGGEYLIANGIVKKIDIFNRIVIMQDKTEIPISEIIEIDSNIFEIYKY